MVPRRDGQRLERRQKTAGTGAGATGMVAAADRSGDRRPSGDGERLPAGGRDRGASRGRSPRVWPPKPATSGRCPPTRRGKTGHSAEVSTDSAEAKPATSAEVSTDSGASLPVPGRSPTASACEPYRELIEEAAARGRNAMAIWQDLVDDHGFKGKYASVRRFVARLRATAPPEARVVITTAPGEEARSTTARGRWCATARPASTDACGSSC